MAALARRNDAEIQPMLHQHIVQLRAAAVDHTKLHAGMLLAEALRDGADPAVVAAVRRADDNGAVFCALDAGSGLLDTLLRK